MPTASSTCSDGNTRVVDGPDFPTEASTACDCGSARLCCLPSISHASGRHLRCTQPFLPTASMILMVASSIWIDRLGWQAWSGAGEHTVALQRISPTSVICSFCTPVCTSDWPNTLIIETKVAQCPGFQCPTHFEVTWTVISMLSKTGFHTVSTDSGSQGGDTLRPRPMSSLPCIFILPSYLNYWLVAVWREVNQQDCGPRHNVNGRLRRALHAATMTTRSSSG